MWNFIGPCGRSETGFGKWYDKHVFFINASRNRELRGRWFLGAAAIIYFTGQYIVYRLMK